MIINTNENTSIITQEKATIIELVKKIEALYPKFKNQNIILYIHIKSHYKDRFYMFTTVTRRRLYSNNKYHMY